MSPTAPGAIVFTDIVGFTELTDQHGDDIAIAMLELQDKVVQDSLPANSRIVKELGDGLLLWFADAQAAVRTSLEMQHRLEAESLNDIPLWVRIGAHWGSPRRRGDDIIGRDVNLASRIAGLAGPGEVLCSDSMAVAAGAIDGIEYLPLGPVFVRGIVEPIPLMRITRAQAFYRLKSNEG